MLNERIGPTVRSALLLAAALAMLGGCGGDDITQYSAPRVQESEAPPPSGPMQPPPAQAPSEPQRLLAAIVPQDGQSWFFKLLGPVDAVGEQKEAFDAFVRSVRLQPDAAKPITWKAPEEWREEAGGGFRYATFHIGSDESTALELSVSRAGGTVLDNFNRWRGQIGLPAIAEAALDDSTTRIPIGDATAIVIDETGVGSSKSMGGPFAPTAPHALPSAGSKSAALPISDTPPEDWQPSSGSSMSLLAYRVGQGDQQASVTVTVLQGAAGGVEANIGRWGQQVGLPPNDDTVGETRKIQLDGEDAVYVDLPGPDGAGRQRILGVILAREGRTWFFKMRGDHDLVGAQKAAFDAWIQSIHFKADGK